MNTPLAPPQLAVARRAIAIAVAWLLMVHIATAQALGEPDREQPGDEQIQAYLAREAEALDAQFMVGIETKEKFAAQRPRLQHEYFDMLGLWPLPERTPLKATVTGSLSGPGYVVDMLHYQSRPGLYVTGNLYRPAETKRGERLPAVLYVCGHAGEGRNGGKTAFQSHGLWLARHGYICLIVDTLQLGEIGATHHGTYREGRWWWHSRGYTPAAVECWNGVRGIDYLVNRPDVDPQRIGVTGISGGGAATFWVTAADDRVRVAVPISGMSDLTSYVSNRVINGHCDCMFLYNHHQWPWTQIAALVAPRPLLFVNSDNDSIFPMDGNRRISARLEKLYGMLGKRDHFDSFVSQGGHAYRQDIRQAVFRFLNTHLKNDSSPVTDTEVDLPDGKAYAIAPERLRVFPTDKDLPVDQLNTKIDEILVPAAKLELPTKENFAAWKQDLRDRLGNSALRLLQERVPSPDISADAMRGMPQLSAEKGIRFQLYRIRELEEPKSVTLVVSLSDNAHVAAAEFAANRDENEAVFLVEPRGVGNTRWTEKNPPNYVARSCALLGRTADEGRIRDIAATARSLRRQGGRDVPVQLAGRGPAAVLCAYAALIEPDIAGIIALEPLLTHMDSSAPQLLGVLRTCDVPDVFGMLAPRPLHIRMVDEQAEQSPGDDEKSRPAKNSALLDRIRKIYAAAGASQELTITHKR